MPLTPEAVKNKQFTSSRFGRHGYDEDEVDAFLDEVEEELRRLLTENAELRAQLGEHGGVPVAAPAPLPAPAPPPEPAPAPTPAPTPTLAAGERPEEAALRTLVLAQKTADEVVTAARTEADQIVGAARGRADQLDRESRERAEQLDRETRERAEQLDRESRERAEQLDRESRERAEQLDRDAREKHAAALGDLDRQRTTLQQQVEELRGFEREYRSRLRSFLEEQLRTLAGQHAAAGGGRAGADGRNGSEPPGGAGGPGGPGESAEGSFGRPPEP